jgi:hypothetical protein
LRSCGIEEALFAPAGESFQVADAFGSIVLLLIFCIRVHIAPRQSLPQGSTVSSLPVRDYSSPRSCRG